MDVLDDDCIPTSARFHFPTATTTPVLHTVLGPVRHPQALAPQYALRSHADNALVGPDIDPRNARLVIGHADARGARAGVPVCAPRRVVDCVLATVAGALV